MVERSTYECAGNLAKELEEFKKTSVNEDQVESKYSTTIKCGAFLTLRCC